MFGGNNYGRCKKGTMKQILKHNLFIVGRELKGWAILHTFP